jgi:hypothetical protein
VADDHAVGSRRRPATPQRLTIDSHRLLAARRKAIIDALVTDPDRGRLLFANASLAFKDAGVNLSPEIADHVLHTVRQSAAATTRRERLTAQLKKALGVVPHPSDPSWLATTLFRTLELTPLATKGHDAVYQPPIPTDIEDRLRGHLPPASRPRLPARGTTTPRKIPWRLNLAADVPELPAARRAPTKVSLDELWFYLGAHQLVRPLLELGILEVSVLPTLTRAQYEAVKAGGPTGGFLDWVDSVTFPEERVRPARAGSTAKTAAKKAAPAETAPAKGAAAAETAAKKAAPVKKAAPAKTAAKKAAPTRTAATKTTTADKTAATRRTAPVAKAVKKTGARPARPR